jgi:glutaredoxin
MFRSINNKLFLIASLFIAVIMMPAFTGNDKDKDDEKAKNLKVLSKKLSGEEIHNIMRMYSKALGVRCAYCHEVKQTADGKWDADFAADSKPEKETARKMIKMTEAINKKYLGKMGKEHMDPITCVTCHMGRTQPMVSADSLPQPKK